MHVIFNRKMSILLVIKTLLCGKLFYVYKSKKGKLIIIAKNMYFEKTVFKDMKYFGSCFVAVFVNHMCTWLHILKLVV